MAQEPEHTLQIGSLKPDRVTFNENFSVSIDDVPKNDVFEVNVRGFGLVRLEIGFRELTIGVYDEKDGPKVEFTVPHPTFGDGLPMIKSVRDGKA